MGLQNVSLPLGRKGAGAIDSHSCPSLASHLPVVVPLPDISTRELPSLAYSVTPVIGGPLGGLATHFQLLPDNAFFISVDFKPVLFALVSFSAISGSSGAKSFSMGGAADESSLKTFMLVQPANKAAVSVSEARVLIIIVIRVSPETTALLYRTCVNFEVIRLPSEFQ
jgi:hypothetical protein